MCVHLFFVVVVVDVIHFLANAFTFGRLFLVQNVLLPNR